MLSLSVLGNVRAASSTTTTTIRDRLTRLVGGSDDNNNIGSNINGDNNNNNNNDNDSKDDSKPPEHNCERYCPESKSQHKSHHRHHRQHHQPLEQQQQQQQHHYQHQEQERRVSRKDPVYNTQKVTPAPQPHQQKYTKHQLLQQYYNCLQKQRQYQKEKRQRRRRDRSCEHGQGHSSASENDNNNSGGGCSFLDARGCRPMKSPCDARTEAVTFLGLLKHEEERLVERSKELSRRDRSFIQDVFTCVVDEWTPLHACTLRGARKLVKVALKAGVDPNLEMGVPEGLPGRCAPLHLAAYRGDVSILQLLVQNGAHLDKLDDLNRTPLYYAVQRRNTLAARKLIKYGADCSGLTAEENDFFREDIAKRGHGPAVLCIPVPVRTGSQKHRHHHHHHHENHQHFNSSSTTTTSTNTTSGSYQHQHQQHHRSSSSSGGGSSTKYKLDS